ncbi:AAA family ATPase [Actinocorallia populi]|uniref:AAA family ATPase n=1 Tax=Actinocorallia populi TaxID=2079200 RepID=UPI000D08B424|nr:SMC family ATPase [Actinocorallia populi]
MRLLRLKVTAFGPFSGTEEVDFQTLSEAGLFLINGPTGAGKTSVLDAVCFALYGQVPGARNAVKLLRSDHAAPGVAPLVELEADIRGRRFRFTRSPAWERPKLRGTGTRMEQSKILVEEWTGGEWIGHTNRLDEAGDLVQRLLGMTAPQFNQVAMLPQGEFAAFLRANAEERRRVLEKLFATEIYAAVEKWLADERARTNREAEALRVEAAATADRVAELTAAPRPDGSAALLLPWATELTAHHSDLLTVTSGLLSESEERLAGARRRHDEGRTLASLQERHVQAVRRRDALASRTEERKAWGDRLGLADRATRVLPYGRAVTARREALAEAETRSGVLRRRIAPLTPPSCLCEGLDSRDHALRSGTARGTVLQEGMARNGVPGDDALPGDGRRNGAVEDGHVCPPLTEDAPLEVLRRAEQVWRAELARLEALRGQEARHREVLRELTGGRERESRWTGEEERLRVRLEELPGRVEEQRAALQEARIQASGAEAAAKVVDDAEQAVEDARRRDLVGRGLQRAEAELRTAVDRAQQARDRVQELRELRLTGMAAALAADLVPGEPCKVCGSAEHPAPAAGSGEVPSQDEELRAAQEADAAQRAREDLSGRVGGMRAEHDLLQQRSDLPVETLAQGLDEARTALEAARSAVTRAETLERGLRTAEAELESARRAHSDAGRELAETRAALSALDGEEARLRAELDAARGGDFSLQARLARLNDEADLLTRTIEAGVRAATARDELEAAGRALAEAATAEGFASSDEAARARLSPDDRARLESLAGEYDAEAAAVRDLLSDPQLTAAAARPVPDLAALESAAARAEQAHTVLVSARDRSAHRHARLAELHARLRAQLAKWAPAADAHERTARLAGLVNGQPPNTLQMRLSAYVLAARLEQVVAAANERLTTMSAGRYLLKHTIDKAAGDTKRAAGGLGLRVIDGWTGQERDPATLSGGESFISSLSLALGLADVVTAEAGGAEIATLFVDEGFGTLDEDTLDEVMTVLDSLRDGGRAVGVVSHVAELRTRIPTQLRLRKSRTGSTLCVVG